MTCARHVLVVLSVALACAVAAGAQDDPHAACAAMGWVPREILERPVRLRPGTGNAHEAVTTGSPEAQALLRPGAELPARLRLDRGGALVPPGAACSTRSSPWPGSASRRVYSGLDDPEGRAPRARGGRRRSPPARARASSGASRCGRSSSRPWPTSADASRHAAYKKAIDDALAIDIGDVELWLVRGNAEEASAAGRGQRGGAASTAFYREALRLAPDNAAAHHYLTHSYETIGQIPLALEHGEAYARLAPAVPHAHHMWGHDLRRVGRIDEAIAAFRAHRRAGEGLLRRRGHTARARLAPRAQPRPAGDGLPAQGADAAGRGRDARGHGPAADHRLPRVQPEAPDRLPARPRALGRGSRGGPPPRAGQVERHARGRPGAVGTRARWPSAASPRRARRCERRSASWRTFPPWGPGIDGDPRPGPAVDRRPARRAAPARRPSRRGRAAPRGRGAYAARACPGPDAWIQALFRLESMARMARDVGDWELADVMAAPDGRARFRLRRLAPGAGPRRRAPGGPEAAARGAGRGRALLARRGSRPARARHGPPPPRLESLKVSEIGKGLWQA